jgi:hypothetical protein
MKKTFLMTPDHTNDVYQHTGWGFFAVPEQTAFLCRHVSFRVRR